VLHLAAQEAVKVDFCRLGWRAEGGGVGLLGSLGWDFSIQNGDLIGNQCTVV